jgi:hypothetical protein
MIAAIEGSGITDVAARFGRLFAGLDRAYGETIIPPGAKAHAATGKVEAVCKTIHRKLTIDAWRWHIDGKLGLGVIPVRDNGTVRIRSALTGSSIHAAATTCL